jgi:uncharacterized membrane protein YhaH (DUF805 family)
MFISRKDHTMFWPFVAATAIGTALFQLGAQSVWIAVMAFGLKAIVAVIAAIFALTLLSRVKGE